VEYNEGYQAALTTLEREALPQAEEMLLVPLIDAELFARVVLTL